MLRIFLAVCLLSVSSGAGRSADQPVDIKIGYLRQAPSKIRLSLIDVPAANDGLAGAQLAIDDDNATGRFLNQRYTLVEKVLDESDDPVAAMNALADQGVSFIVTSLDADRLLKVADAGRGRGETFINVSALDERLRTMRERFQARRWPGSASPLPEPPPGPLPSSATPAAISPD